MDPRTGLNEENGENERWKPVVRFEGLYEVSDLGRVRRAPHWTVSSRGHRRFYPERILRLMTVHHGYKRAVMTRNGQRCTEAVHRMVLEAFVGPCPPKHEACHNSEPKWDNRLSNLRWGTKSENIQDLVRSGNHSNARKTECKNGHPYLPDNLFINPTNGGRECIKCRRAAVIRYRDRQRSKKGEK